MFKFKITSKDLNHTVEYFGESSMMDQIVGWLEAEIYGLPERPELDAEGNPTGNILPAEYTIEITDISSEHALAECISKRKSEYPSAEEFLNAFFDGGETALAELQAKRLLVKAKYPKPSEGEE
jgi:hypothetical protein